MLHGLAALPKTTTCQQTMFAHLVQKNSQVIMLHAQLGIASCTLIALEFKKLRGEERTSKPGSVMSAEK
jgi:hypothetical protein